jgi:uncharacterized protein (DUF1684 family)
MRSELTALLLGAGAIFIFACKAPQDITTVAHPVHADTFMARKMENELLQIREKRNEYFKSDAESPLPEVIRPAFSGLEYYPINLKYRFEGPVLRYPNPVKFKMITTSGETREAVKFGYVRFQLEGKEFKLQVYRLLDLEQKDLLFIPFVDASAGKETYPAGRYIDLVESKNGLYVIDFNAAYNPSCSYGGNYPCPVTPPENKLAFSIPAGERNLELADRFKKSKVL